MNKTFSLSVEAVKSIEKICEITDLSKSKVIEKAVRELLEKIQKQQ